MSKYKRKNNNMRDTRHHLVPSSRGGTGHHENIKNLPEKTHRNFHAVFGNATPIEQIEAILKLNEKVFVEVFKNKVFDLLDEFKDNVYKNKVIHKVDCK